MARRKKNKDGAQGMLVLLSLIALVMCVGAWNYHRNLELESQNQGARPFKGYSDEALQQLAEAYTDEGDALRRRYDSAMARRQGVRNRDGLIAEKVAEFERVRRDGDRIRAVNAEVAEKEARLRDIRGEQDLRKGSSDINAHLRRLTSL